MWYDGYWTKGSDGIWDYHRWIVGQLRELDGPVLDVGCGDGAYLKLLATSKKVNPSDILGVDFSSTAVEKYAINGGKAIVANAEHLPFEDGE